MIRKAIEKYNLYIVKSNNDSNDNFVNMNETDTNELQKTEPKNYKYHEKHKPSFQEEPKEKKNVREYSKNIMEMNQRT